MLWSISAGVSAAACFGTADYVAARVGRAEGWCVTLLGAQAASVPWVVGAAWGLEGAPDVGGHVGALFGLGLAHLLGSVALYRALEVGVVSVVSPVAGAFGVVTAVLAVALGHPMSAALALALVCVVAGSMLAARGRASSSMARDESRGGDAAALEPRRGWVAGAAWAVGSALALGVSFYGLDWMAEKTHHVLWTVAAYRTMSAVGMAGVVGVDRRRASPEDRAARSPWRTRLARWHVLGMLDAGGMTLYAIGCARGDVAVVAVLASLFPAITVSLAQWRLRERLGASQWLGLALLMAGVLMVGLTS